MYISICDSGEFADDTGHRSAPRVESVIRKAVLDDRLRISGISYVKSRPDTLPDEPDTIRTLRNRDRWDTEKNRVLNIAKTFQVELTDVENNFSTAEADLILVVMRPSQERSDLIRRAVEVGKSAIVFPPYFHDQDDLDTLCDSLSESQSENRVILWLPYRFSVASKAIRRRFQKSEIAAIELTVSCGPYLNELLVHEWSLPFLDVLRVIAGPFEKIEITRTMPNGLPVFHLRSVHRNASNYVLASTLITTAGGTLQNTEAGRLKVFSTKMESIQTTSTFTGFVHRTNTLHQFTEISHDQQASVLTGYESLLRCCLDNKWDEDESVKPTLASFSQMQRLLDTFQRFNDDAAFVECPQTKEIIFEECRAQTS